MPKLAIYVPKSDMKLVEKWRKRINFSKVFMRALKDEIEKLSPAKKEYSAAAEYYADVSKPGDLADFGAQLGRAHLLECKISRKDLPDILRVADEESSASERKKLVLRQIKRDAKASRRATELVESHASASDAEQTLSDGYVQAVATTWHELKKRE